MRMIGRANHANLIRLLGFCNEGRSPILVYEFMPKGSLAKHIFEGQRTSWKRRAEILLGAARRIQYLHGECEVKIIHRDIKPENILVGEDWTAKISDFGLAKLLIGNQTRTMVAGTKGYVAPECEKEINGAGEAQVTEKADVYGNGMVVLETICGKRNREAGMRLREAARESWEAGKLRRLAVEKDNIGMRGHLWRTS